MLIYENIAPCSLKTIKFMLIDIKLHAHLFAYDFSYNLSKREYISLANFTNNMHDFIKLFYAMPSIN